MKLEQPFSSTDVSYVVSEGKFVTEEDLSLQDNLRVPFDPYDCLSTSSFETTQPVSSTVSRSLVSQDE